MQRKLACNAARVSGTLTLVCVVVEIHVYHQVERANWVKVEAVNAKGKKIKKKYTDWTARIFMVSPIAVDSRYRSYI